MEEVFVKKGFRMDGEKYEEGQSYEFKEDVAEKLREKGVVIDQPKAEEKKESKKFEIDDRLKKFLVKRGFSKNPEKNRFSKETKVKGRDIRLVRDFGKSEKGAKMAIDMETEESAGDIAEEHPDMEYFTKLREEEMDLGEAIARAESDSKHYEREEDVEPEDVAENISEGMTSGGGQAQMEMQQELEVDMEPAIELDSTDTTEEVEERMITGLEKEDLDQLVWDPEKEPGLPYERPTASAEAYDLFSRIVEMALSVQYTVGNVNFEETDKSFKCDVTIVRKSTNPDMNGKKLKGYKTVSKKSASGRDQWRERLYTKAKRNALKQEIPKTWISRLLKKYKDKMDRGESW